MRIVWILNHYAQEPGGPGGTRHYSLSKYLGNFGWKAFVIAASVELNTGRQRLEEDESSRLDEYDGVPFLWLKTPSYMGNGLGRVLNMVAYTVRAVLPASTRSLARPNVIIGSSVHPFAAVAGALLAARFKVPFVFEVRDLWPETLIDMGRISADSMLVNVLRRLEKWLYKRSQKIIVLLPKAGDYIVPLGIDCQKIVVVPNGVDMSQFPASEPVDHGGVFTLMYFGAHGSANGLENLLYAMDILQNKFNNIPVRLRLIGDGPLKASLVAKAEELGLNNVSFEPPVSKNRIPELAAEADGFVFNLIDAPVFKYGISSNKLFDFMAGARPIIFCCNAANNPVAEANAGITVPAENPASLAEAIATLVGMPIEQRAKMGKMSRQYVINNHDFSSLAGKLAQALDSLI